MTALTARVSSSSVFCSPWVLAAAAAILNALTLLLNLLAPLFDSGRLEGGLIP